LGVLGEMGRGETIERRELRRIERT